LHLVDIEKAYQGALVRSNWKNRTTKNVKQGRELSALIGYGLSLKISPFLGTTT
jgi:hypothetical protein